MNQPEPFVMHFRFEELACDLPPPQLASTDPQASSTSPDNLPARHSLSSEVILTESSEATLEGVFRQERDDQRAKIAAFLGYNSQIKPESKDIIIEEKEPSSEMMSDSNSNRKIQGPLARVVDNII